MLDRTTTVAFANAREPHGPGVQAGRRRRDRSSSIVNHFKSKGSAGVAGRRRHRTARAPRTAPRPRQAKSLRGLRESRRSRATDKVFLIGDFNAYAKEDPMQVLYDAGYTDAAKARRRRASTRTRSAACRARSTTCCSRAAMRRATGADIWEINAEESVALEYSRYNYNVHALLRRRPVPRQRPRPGGRRAGPEGAADQPVDLNFLGINDFHGRIDANTVMFAGTVEKLRAAASAAGGPIAFLSAGDNIGASLFASAVAAGPADHRRAERAGARRVGGGQPRVRQGLGRPERPRDRGRHATRSGTTSARTSTSRAPPSRPCRSTRSSTWTASRSASSARSPRRRRRWSPRRHHRARVRRPGRGDQPRRRELSDGDAPTARPT